MINDGRLLNGQQGLRATQEERDAMPRSTYTCAVVNTHPNYDQWVRAHLWRGVSIRANRIYDGQTSFRTWQTWHGHVNEHPYQPGPGKVLQPNGWTDEYEARRRREASAIAPLPHPPMITPPPAAVQMANDPLISRPTNTITGSQVRQWIRRLNEEEDDNEDDDEDDEG